MYINVRDYLIVKKEVTKNKRNITIYYHEIKMKKSIRHTNSFGILLLWSTYKYSYWCVVISLLETLIKSGQVLINSSSQN